MTKFKDEFVIKVRRKIVAWEETIYIVYDPKEEDAIKIALEEKLYHSNKRENGIISQVSSIDKTSIRRLSMEDAWILDTSSVTGEKPKGQPVAELLFSTKKRSKKISENSRDYWKYHVMNQIPKE